MKQFIVLAAVLPILLLFLSQLMLDGQRQMKMTSAESAIRTFCLEGSYYGRIEAEALRERLSDIFDAPQSAISVEIAPAREGVLSYRIAFPVGKIMAGEGLMRISENRNDGYAVMRGEIVLPPEKSEDEPGESAEQPADREKSTGENIQPPDTEGSQEHDQIFFSG